MFVFFFFSSSQYGLNFISSLRPKTSKGQLFWGSISYGTQVPWWAAPTCVRSQCRVLATENTDTGTAQEGSFSQITSLSFSSNGLCSFCPQEVTWTWAEDSVAIVLYVFKSITQSHWCRVTGVWPCRSETEARRNSFIATDATCRKTIVLLIKCLLEVAEHLR